MLKATTVKSLQVAVLGSGITGSTAARKLAEKGIRVTVFEAGHGIGGRTSTRITRDEYRYQFDHGAQYIGTPKTEDFRETLQNWESNGWVKEWTGKFMTASADGFVEEKGKERFVGVPGMHSICRNLLHHENIKVKLQTRANASYNDSWQLTNDKTKEDLGNFDWLLASDRLSGNQDRNDFASGNAKELFTSKIHEIKSVKSLTAMVVFESPTLIDTDSIQFSGKDNHSLGWAARDTSKPGRMRSDQKECWVLQSHPKAAEEILEDCAKENMGLGEIRERAQEILVQDFLNVIPQFVDDTSNSNSNPDITIPIPEVAYRMGHRWGAGFPVPPEEFVGKECQLFASKRFVACGDYFGKLPGRIEGAVLSGEAAAKQLLSKI